MVRAAYPHVGDIEADPKERLNVMHLNAPYLRLIGECRDADPERGGSAPVGRGGARRAERAVPVRQRAEDQALPRPDGAGCGNLAEKRSQVMMTPLVSDDAKRQEMP